MLYSLGASGGRGSTGGRLSDVFDLLVETVSIRINAIDLNKRLYLSHARCAQAYALAGSSSLLKLLAFVRDCASRLLARSTNSSGRGPDKRGIKLCNACSTGRLISAYHFLRRVIL